MLGAGVFRQLLHVVDTDTRSIEFDGIPLWFARCGAACLLVEIGLRIDRDRCPTCDQSPGRPVAPPPWSSVDGERNRVMPAEDRIPRLPELVWARGTDDSPTHHVVIIPGRTYLDEPLDSVVARALCGARAVPVRAIGGFPVPDSPQAVDLCDVCLVGLRAIRRAIGT